jgi:predicted TIM-barrel fold metal-dependent hydrolase
MSSCNDSLIWADLDWNWLGFELTGPWQSKKPALANDQKEVADEPAAGLINSHALLERCPNFHVDTCARISELGRQPFTARRFMETYQDRILFGIDRGPQLEAYRTYYRFLEIDDEFFNYSWDGSSSQGRWHIHAINLPKPVLKKICRQHAERIFGL